MLVLILTILLFLILSIVLLQGKGEFLIAGYNTMTEDEKKEYNTVELCKATGKMMLAITFSMSLFLIGDFTDNDMMFAIGTVLIFVSVIVGIINMNTNKKIKK